MRRVEHAPYPCDLALVEFIARAAFLVAPVRGYAELGLGVHFARSDLDLERFVLRPDHGGVNRAIVIVLWGRGVIVELAWNEAPQAVHDTERGIAFGERVDQDAHGSHIKDLFELHVLELHLAIDAVDVFGTPINRRGDARFAQFALKQRADRLDVAFSLHARLGQGAAGALVVVRPLSAESQALELPLQIPDPETVCERREDLACLQGEPQL